MTELRGAMTGPRVGKNGRLFLGAQDGFDLDLFVDGGTWNRPMLDRWRATLARRGRELARRGIPYIFFIVPDAPSVYPQDLPTEVPAGFRPPGEVFLEAMGAIENVIFVYPLADLLQAKGGLDLYQKNDTHWTSYGSYVGYRSLMRALEGLVPCRTVPARNVQFSFRRSYGDLGSLMHPEQAEEIPVARISGSDVASAVSYEGVGRQTATETTCPDCLPKSRAIFFRDSFFTDLAPYVARSFSHLLTIGTTTRVMLDVIDSWHSDVVVSQVAERKLCFLETDHQLEGYDTLYKGVYGSPAGKRLLQARLGLGGNPAAALALIDEDFDAYRGHPEQAFSAALIYEANGQAESADELAQNALAARPTHASFLALAARTALACRRASQAVELAGEAAMRAPYNGYFHELHTYCLMQDAQPRQALAAAEDALGHIEDHANLWYWASILQEAIGSKRLAADRAQRAHGLDPEHALYTEQVEKLKGLLQPA